MFERWMQAGSREGRAHARLIVQTCARALPVGIRAQVQPSGVETGEGGCPSLPASRLPQWRYPHGPPSEEMLEEVRRPGRSGVTDFVGVSPRTAPASRDGGGAPEAREGWGYGNRIIRETGEGVLPPPRRPHPQRRYAMGMHVWACATENGCKHLWLLACRRFFEPTAFPAHPRSETKTI